GTLHSSPFIQVLLFGRGIRTSEETEGFLSLDVENLHPPRRLASVDQAADGVYEAIESEERILVYGDYDGDGVWSTAMLIESLRQLRAHCDYYIPKRFTEGYGPNEQAFKNAAKYGFSVIITVDTGIATTHEVEAANELGIDVIITDHHEIQENIPDAYAIIHPKLSPDYPFKELAGAGD